LTTGVAFMCNQTAGPSLCVSTDCALYKICSSCTSLPLSAPDYPVLSLFILIHDSSFQTLFLITSLSLSLSLSRARARVYICIYLQTQPPAPCRLASLLSPHRVGGGSGPYEAGVRGGRQNRSCGGGGSSSSSSKIKEAQPSSRPRLSVCLFVQY
jgi:hypothetical protein